MLCGTVGGIGQEANLVAGQTDVGDRDEPNIAAGIVAQIGLITTREVAERPTRDTLELNVCKGIIRYGVAIGAN